MLPSAPRTPPSQNYLKTDNSAQTCDVCNGRITPAEINFCKVHAARFAAQDLCRSCQKFAPPTKKSSAPIAPKKLDLNPSQQSAPSAPNQRSESSPESCETCSGAVSSAEIDYCKAHATRFEGKQLCRRCQAPQPSQSQAPKPAVRITIAPRVPEKKTHSQNAAPNPVKASPTGNAQTQTWEERYYEIKIAHPRAYEEWTPSEEAKLVGLFKNRTPIRSIAQTLYRRPGGIRARLIKLKLLEPSKGRAAVGI
jgi:hypothetical protein